MEEMLSILRRIETDQTEVAEHAIERERRKLLADLLLRHLATTEFGEGGAGDRPAAIAGSTIPQGRPPPRR